MQSNNLSNPQNSLKPKQEATGLSIWVGTWAMLAGILLFAERVGWLSPDIKWGAPLALVMVGVSVIYDNLRTR